MLNASRPDQTAYIAKRELFINKVILRSESINQKPSLYFNSFVIPFLFPFNPFQAVFCLTWVFFLSSSPYFPLTGQTNILKKCLIMKEVDKLPEKYRFVIFNLLTGV